MGSGIIAEEGTGTFWDAEHKAKYILLNRFASTFLRFCLRINSSTSYCSKSIKSEGSNTPSSSSAPTTCSDLIFHLVSSEERVAAVVKDAMVGSGSVVVW